MGDKKTPAPTELLARVRIRYLQESATPSHVLGATDFGIYILNEPIQKLAVAAYKAEVAAIINTDAPGGKGGRFSGITHGLEKATATIASKAGAEAMMKGGTLANADAKGMLTAQSAARTEAEREAKAVK